MKAISESKFTGTMATSGSIQKSARIGGGSNEGQHITYVARKKKEQEQEQGVVNVFDVAPADSQKFDEPTEATDVLKEPTKPYS